MSPLSGSFRYDDTGGNRELEAFLGCTKFYDENDWSGSGKKGVVEVDKQRRKKYLEIRIG